MHKHTITYQNFNDQTRTRDLYFNLTEAEITKLQKDYLHVGGVQVVMDEAVKSGDTKKLLDFFELLVRRSYGIKSDDGERHDKSEQIWNDFENSAFYSPLYMSFFEQEGKVGSDFINAVMPADLIAKAVANVQGEGEAALAAERAKQYAPDAREIFENARKTQEAAKETAKTDTFRVQETAPAPSADPTQDPDFLAWKASQGAEKNASSN